MGGADAYPYERIRPTTQAGTTTSAKQATRASCRRMRPRAGCVQRAFSRVHADAFRECVRRPDRARRTSRKGAENLVENRKTREEREFRVIDVTPARDGKWRVGIEFVQGSTNFWKIYSRQSSCLLVTPIETVDRLFWMRRADEIRVFDCSLNGHLYPHCVMSESSVAELLVAAEEAMHESKRQGKNRVTSQLSKVRAAKSAEQSVSSGEHPTRG
jgi:hypothetical protein